MVSIYQNTRIHNTENHDDMSVPLFTPQLLVEAYNKVQLQGAEKQSEKWSTSCLHPPPPTSTSILQQMVQKTEVAIEKAAVTLSRGFRSAAHGSSEEGQK